MATNRMMFDVEVLRPKWGWMLVLGILMVALGTIALILIPAATIGTALVLGWLLLISGVVELIHAFGVQRWGGFFLHLTCGILGLLIGLMVVTHPVAGAVAFTLLFASFLVVIGLFRLIAAFSIKFPHWGWAFFDGVVTLALGIVLWADWPWSGYWFLGLSVGISLLMRGWSYVMMAFAVRGLAAPAGVPRAA